MARLTSKEPFKLWIAADEAGFISVFKNKPKRIPANSDSFWGDWKGELLDILGPKELRKYTNEVPRWEDDPIMVEI